MLYIYRKQSKSLTATRQEGIAYNNTRMRLQYIKEIFEGLCEREDLLSRMYFEMQKCSLLTQEVDDMFKQKINLLNMIKTGMAKGKVIVYGAGKMGKNISMKIREMSCGLQTEIKLRYTHQLKE